MASSVKPPSEFDYVKAAEALLEKARRLAASKHDNSNKAEEMVLRREITVTAKNIALEVSDPAVYIKSQWPVVADFAACNLFMDWKVFDHIPLNDPVGISFADLAKAVDGEMSLIARLASFLITTSKLRPGTGGPSHVAHSRVSPYYRSDHPFSPLTVIAFGQGMKVYAQWPSYFAQYGRREPPDVSHTPMSFAWGHPHLAPWEIKALYPEYATAFAKSMKSKQMSGGDFKLVGPGSVFDVSWIGEMATTRHKTDSVVVDVGGGLGQLLQDVLREIPDVSPTQCVLQDRGEVINEAREVADKVLSEVVMMEHDFLTEQPVKGAAVYFLRRILLDWPDRIATHILKHLADALPADDDRARVVIMEPGLDNDPSGMGHFVDVAMLVIGGKMRNEKGFGEIVTAAGLKVVGYYTGGTDQVVVCARD